MSSKLSRKAKKDIRHKRIRKKLTGTADVPRVSVYRSKKNISAQIVDDISQSTILHVSSLSLDFPDDIKEADRNIQRKVAISKLVGKHLAELAKSKGIQKACFDRGGHSYHGRVKALADGLREGGVKI